MNKVFDSKLGLFVSGLVLGLIAVVLAIGGNPGNMAFCIACFIRDIAGGIKLHQAGVVQYFRPEIAGLVLGSFIISLMTKEFKVTSGENPLQKFVLGALTMIMALVFLGCPLRMVIRMSAGDLNAYVAFVGFVLGIVCGAIFLKNGYEMTDSKKENNSFSGFILPILLVVGMILYNLPQEQAAVETALAQAGEEQKSVLGLLFAHTIKGAGPGGAHAAVVVSFVLAIVFGIIAQKARTCFAGSIRNLIFTKDASMILPICGLFVALLVYNVVAGKFNPSFTGQQIAHNESLWNFISMFGVGLAATFAGGCPLRQLILAGEGKIDSVMNVFGMLVGAAFAHNFALASSASGTTANGRVICIVALIIVVIIGCANTKKKA